MARESSSELSSLAARYVRLSVTEITDIADRSQDDLLQVFVDLKRLAACVLSQDETKGQGPRQFFGRE